jgi:hypothetical protein
MRKLLLVSIALAAGLLAVDSARANGGGIATAMTAYYDGKPFTITFSELPRGGEAAVHAHNKSFNTIYQCDACAEAIPGGFVSVLDAIQGDGFNPIWEEHQITFNDDHPPRQFFSDNEVLAAAANGEITITDTDELYICAVVGPKKK